MKPLSYTNCFFYFSLIVETTTQQHMVGIYTLAGIDNAVVSVRVHPAEQVM